MLIVEFDTLPFIIVVSWGQLHKSFLAIQLAILKLFYIQLSGQLQSIYGYGAPEFESGIYTSQSDVYSFGVFMLELLTGRKSYDR